MNQFGILTWNDVASHLSTHAFGTAMRVEKYCVEHPVAGGLTPSLGLPYGQIADHRLQYANCVGLHVRDFGSHYEAHLDQVHPACDLIDHLRQDAPSTYVASGTALGALAALALSRHPAAILAGAVAGGILALLTSKDAASRT